MSSFIQSLIHTACNIAQSSVLKGLRCSFYACWHFAAAVYGTSKDPCSDIYGGPKPFSEPETKALSDFILARNGTWKVYLTLHSYSQMWMAPYGYTRKKPDNYESLVSKQKW